MDNSHHIKIKLKYQVIMNTLKNTKQVAKKIVFSDFYNQIPNIIKGYDADQKIALIKQISKSLDKLELSKASNEMLTSAMSYDQLAEHRKTFNKIMADHKDKPKKADDPIHIQKQKEAANKLLKKHHSPKDAFDDARKLLKEEYNNDVSIWCDAEDEVNIDIYTWLTSRRSFYRLELFMTPKQKSAEIFMPLNMIKLIAKVSSKTDKVTFAKYKEQDRKKAKEDKAKKAAAK